MDGTSRVMFDARACIAALESVEVLGMRFSSATSIALTSPSKAVPSLPIGIIILYNILYHSINVYIWYTIITVLLCLQITPLTAVASPYNPLRCGVAGCRASILTDCPTALRKYNYNGKVVGCKSACIAFNTNQYCCRGPYANPQYCDPTRWSINFASYFKNRCPGAYSYAMDDSTSLYSCVKNNYKITFG